MDSLFAALGWPELVGILVVCSPFALIGFLIIRSLRRRRAGTQANMRSSATAADAVSPAVCLQNYYVLSGGKHLGPYTVQEITSRMASGQISAADMAKREDSERWVALSDVLGTQSAKMVQGAESNGPKGIGGWLLFFSISLMIIGPASSWGNMLSDWKMVQPLFVEHPRLKHAVLLENVGFSFLLVYGFVVGCVICSGSPKGRSAARQFLLVRIIGAAVIELSAFFLTRELPTEFGSAFASGLVTVGTRELGIFCIWWLYFKLSSRVKNTYGPESGAVSQPTDSASRAS